SARVPGRIKIAGSGYAASAANSFTIGRRAAAARPAFADAERSDRCIAAIVAGIVASRAGRAAGTNRDGLRRADGRRRDCALKGVTAAPAATALSHRGRIGSTAARTTRAPTFDVRIDQPGIRRPRFARRDPDDLDVLDG